VIIDTHVHLRSREGGLEELVEVAGKLNYDKLCLFTAGPGYYRSSNEDVLEAHGKYPDLIIPFFYFRLGVDEPRKVEMAHRAGFRGLKLINPSANYNDESYFPVWERCEDLGMITLFHTGIVARSPQNVYFDIDTSRMKVIYLDRIARKFQQMTMFVAHLGNPDYGEAGMMCRWHANMYFDLSGSTLKKKPPAFFEELLWWEKQKVRYKDEFGRGPWEKILFGTDVTPAEMPETMEDYTRLFDALDLPQQYKDAVMGGTAAKLLGLAEAAGAGGDATER
jgi:predicted TIM-barrel fold metal-dependent hydrolase